MLLNSMAYQPVKTEGQPNIERLKSVNSCIYKLNSGLNIQETNE